MHESHFCYTCTVQDICSTSTWKRCGPKAGVDAASRHMESAVVRPTLELLLVDECSIKGTLWQSEKKHLFLKPQHTF